MPHIVVKMYEGQGLPEKQALAQVVAEAVAGFGYDIKNVSASIDDVQPSDWMRDIYGPDIVRRRSSLVKRPGYGPLAEET